LILSAQTIRKLRPIAPLEERGLVHGMSYGLGPCGYDIRIRESLTLKPGDYRLASSFERFNMPDDLVAFVADKSSWARLGITVQNTIIEPGWCGFLTLEISNHSAKSAFIQEGMPIAQIIFQRLDEPTELPYIGKYQDQPPHPVPAIFES
jgi:dCTP deaminase